MSHIDTMPPELLEQWEAELTLAELIKKLRDTREQIDTAEQQLAYQREVEAEALEAISAYRRHLGLEDHKIPQRTPIEQARRQSNLQSLALQANRSSECGSPRELHEGHRDD